MFGRKDSQRRVRRANIDGIKIECLWADIKKWGNCGSVEGKTNRGRREAKRFRYFSSGDELFLPKETLINPCWRKTPANNRYKERG